MSFKIQACLEKKRFSWFCLIGKPLPAIKSTILKRNNPKQTKSFHWDLEWRNEVSCFSKKWLQKSKKVRITNSSGICDPSGFQCEKRIGRCFRPIFFKKWKSIRLGPWSKISSLRKDESEHLSIITAYGLPWTIRIPKK